MIIQGLKEQMVQKAAWVLSERVALFLRKKKNVVIAVPGGSSVAKIYKSFGQCDLPWDRIDLFLLDERLVSVDHPESNYKLVKEHMGSAVPSDLIHQFKYHKGDPVQSVSDYERELENCGGRLDIVLVSSGEDGHIGSLFPNHHSIEQEKKGFILLDDSPKPPAGRMSASLALIRRADTGIVLFFGSGKRKALHDFFDTKLSYKACPARIITELPHYYLLTDQEVDVQ